MTAATLRERINQDLKHSLKQGQPQVTGVLRLLVASLKNEQISKQRELSDEEVVGVVSREVKKRKDSVVAFEQGGRQELADKEKREIQVLQGYLPEQLTEEQIRSQAQAVIADNSGAPFGKIMGQVMSRLKGQADGNVVQKIVKELLA